MLLRTIPILSLLLISNCTVQGSDHVTLWDGHQYTGKIHDTSDCMVALTDNENKRQNIRCGNIAYIIYNQKDTIKYQNDLLKESISYYEKVKIAAKRKGLKLDSLQRLVKSTIIQNDFKSFAKLIADVSDSLDLTCQFNGEDITCHDYLFSFLSTLKSFSELKYLQTTWTEPPQTYLLLKLPNKKSPELILRFSMRWLEGVTLVKKRLDGQQQEEFLYLRNMRTYRPYN